ncbi:hypothetical protein NKR23_g3705 [Pleurostoma richardsiae]|uniref:Uncharacterized protein n=1 Tax=Pleurostoma richardsiae TaxID=41990 RepID=A0AA38RKI2_9PEZI|nr:hypothetical protein NKR23_g3705 [Pleurostoma richardsiae]
MISEALSYTTALVTTQRLVQTQLGRFEPKYSVCFVINAEALHVMENNINAASVPQSIEDLDLTMRQHSIFMFSWVKAVFHELSHVFVEYLATQADDYQRVSLRFLTSDASRTHEAGCYVGTLDFGGQVNIYRDGHDIISQEYRQLSSATMLNKVETEPDR